MSRVDPLRHHVAAAIEGDDVALSHLVRETQTAVWRLCRALGSPGLEDDLVQETYLRMLRSLPQYRYEAPFTIWLLSIARRVCADHVRRRLRQRRAAESVLQLRVDEVSAEYTPVDDLVAALVPDRREAFVLTQYLGLSYEEAALVVGCPIGTIRSRVARAREDLIVSMRAAEAG